MATPNRPGDPDDFKLDDEEEDHGIWGENQDEVEIEFQPVSDEEFLDDVEEQERENDEDR